MRPEEQKLVDALGNYLSYPVDSTASLPPAYDSQLVDLYRLRSAPLAEGDLAAKAFQNTVSYVDPRNPKFRSAFQYHLASIGCKDLSEATKVASEVVREFLKEAAPAVAPPVAPPKPQVEPEVEPDHEERPDDDPFEPSFPDERELPGPKACDM